MARNPWAWIVVMAVDGRSGWRVEGVREKDSIQVDKGIRYSKHYDTKHHILFYKFTSLFMAYNISLIK